MDRGYATAFALNGAAAIHDFEIALAGHTSEDVEAVLPGWALRSRRGDRPRNESGDCRRQPGRTRPGRVAGPLAGDVRRPEVRSRAACSARRIGIRRPSPFTWPWGPIRRTHIPRPTRAAIGSAGHRDFRLLCAYLADLHDGGVYLNVGSAVVLPEVFLKAVSAVRNLGNPLAGFTTVNFDFLQHYRPRVNVVERPHAGSGGAGYAITGHHELMLPLLAAALIEKQT